MHDGRRRLLQTLATGVACGIAGCRTSGTPGTTAGSSTDTAGTRPDATTLEPGGAFAYTYLQPTGNRVLDGGGNVREASAVEWRVEERPEWLVAVPAEEGSLWVVVTSDGTAFTYHVTDGTATQVDPLGKLPAGRPPLVRRGDDGVELVSGPDDLASMSHPMPTAEGLLYPADDGDLVYRTGETSERFDVGTLPDGRIVALGGERYALLGDRTDRYRHAALGDAVEGGSLVVFDAATATIETRHRVGPPAVVEGISPLVADFDGDGDPEIVLTISDATDGARIAVHRPDGTRIATGPIHGSGWRHQLCVAPFAPDGRPELAVVRQPHVGHELEFYRLAGGSLRVVATSQGYSTHAFGSHNLDGALAAALDDDGAVELLVPTTRRDELRTVRRTAGGTEVAWRKSLPGRLQTNVAGVALPDGRVAVGAGTDSVVRVWQG